MKRLPLLSLFIVLAVMLSSCGLHTGLGKIFGVGSSSTTTSSTPGVKTSATKHAKATHTPPAGGGSDSVALTSSGFQPATLTIKVGTTVTWTNNDTVAQSVISDTDNLFASGPLNPGATFKFTFAQTGTFTYHSENTPAGTATIVVTP